MKRNKIYNSYKAQLVDFAKEIPNNDKPLKRMQINNYCDSLTREMRSEAERNDKSEKLIKQWENWLSLTAGNLHP